MHALHDIGIIHGNWVGSKWPQRDYIKITSFDRCLVSVILFPQILSLKYFCSCLGLGDCFSRADDYSLLDMGGRCWSHIS